MLLVGVFWAAIVLELVQLIPKVAMQYENATMAMHFISCMTEASEPEGQPRPDTAAAAMAAGKAAMVVVILLSVVMKLAEVGFYVFGAIYLRRPNVRALFVQPVTAELAEGQ